MQKNKRMGTISIAMCTYNGDAFLKGQLESFSNQSRMPDEIVICDDGSTDTTIEVINGFAENSPFQVRLFVNEENLGSTKNFEKVIGLCTGDIIALADQDDIWYPHKLRVLEDKFFSEPATGVVFTNADIVGEKLQCLGYTLWDSLRFSSKKQKLINSGRAFNVLVNTNVVTGATMAFRSEIKDLVLPISPDWIHDGWIALLASVENGISIIPEPLLQYRQHSRQQLGALRMGMAGRVSASSSNDSDYFLERANQYNEVLMTLVKKGLVRDEEKLDIMRGKVRHFMSRSQINDLGFARFKLIAKELLRRNYTIYSDGISSMLKDVLGTKIINLILSKREF